MLLLKQINKHAKTILQISIFCSLTLTTHINADTTHIDTPADITQQYIDNINKEKWENVAQLFHRESLIEFKESLMPLFADENEAEFGQSLFGNKTAKQIKQLDPHTFFAKFLEKVLAAKISTGIKKQSLTIVGDVQEKPTLRHVLIRINNETNLSNSSQSDWNVITLKPDNSQNKAWRILVGGKIKRYTHAIKRKFMIF